MAERSHAVVWHEKGISVPMIHQRLMEGGSRVSVRSLYYLVEKYRTKGEYQHQYTAFTRLLILSKSFTGIYLAYAQ